METLFSNVSVENVINAMLGSCVFFFSFVCAWSLLLFLYHRLAILIIFIKYKKKRNITFRGTGHGRMTISFVPLEQKNKLTITFENGATLPLHIPMSLIKNQWLPIFENTYLKTHGLSKLPLPSEYEERKLELSWQGRNLYIHELGHRQQVGFAKHDKQLIIRAFQLIST